MFKKNRYLKKQTSALTIAGSDSSGGAGIQADLKTFTMLKVYGASVITAVTAQNTKQVFQCEPVSLKIITNQLTAVMTDLKINFIKIGMLYNAEIIRLLVNYFKNHHQYHLILDPVMISKSGYMLLNQKDQAVLIKELIPLAYLITPNILEAEKITSLKIKSVKDMKNVARKIHKLGATHVLIKGGHLQEAAIDVLFSNNLFYYFKTKRLDYNFTHGAGCTYSSAITAGLTKNLSLIQAIKKAKKFVYKGINRKLIIGNGNNPLNHIGL